MTKEDKELLFIDLCARLPYRPKVKTINDDDIYTLLSLHLNKSVAVVGMVFDDVIVTSKIKVEDIKPYLFPLSSMTEEQKKELGEKNWALQSWGITSRRANIITHFDCLFLINWLIRNNFDYMGLIPKGLAIDATGKGIY